MKSHEGKVEEEGLGLVVTPDDVHCLLGVHVGGEHVLVVLAHTLVPPEIISHLVSAELDGGAGDHPRPVVHRLLPQTEEAVESSSRRKIIRMTVSQMPFTNSPEGE